MKKKLLVLVAMLLCVVTILASCASSMKLEKVVGDGTYNDENPALTTATKLDVKGEVDDTEGDLAIFVDTDDDGLKTYTVYNLATGATVYTAADAGKPLVDENYSLVRYQIQANEAWGTTLIVSIKATTTVTFTEGDMDSDTVMDCKLMTATGTEIVTLTDVDETQMAGGWFELDLFCIDGKVYRIADDGSVAHAFDWSDLRGEPDIGAKVGDFYFGEGYGDSVAVYDASLNLVATYAVPSYADSPDFYLLSNGNVLIQYTVVQDIMAEDYDYIDGMTKYNLYSFLLNAEKGKVKELNLDYVVLDSICKEPGDDEWYFGEKVENLAWVAYIEDERIDESEHAVKMVVLGNDGKIDGVVDELIPDMACEIPELVATNRWIVSNKAGQAFLLNEKGDVLGEVSGVNWSNMTPDFFLLNSKIYDWDLNVKLDLAEQKCEDYKLLDHGVLFYTEDEETKIYANGEVKTIIDKTTAEAGNHEVEFLDNCDALFVVIDTATEGTVKVNVYNSVGTLLTTVENVAFTPYSIEMVADNSNALLIYGINTEGDTVYYRVA